jgi:hypothetical protein
VERNITPFRSEISRFSRGTGRPNGGLALRVVRAVSFARACSSPRFSLRSASVLFLPLISWALLQANSCVRSFAAFPVPPSHHRVPSHKAAARFGCPRKTGQKKETFSCPTYMLSGIALAAVRSPTLPSLEDDLFSLATPGTETCVGGAFRPQRREWPVRTTSQRSTFPIRVRPSSLAVDRNSTAALAAKSSRIESAHFPVVFPQSP